MLYIQDTFEEVLDILKIHGDDIMMAFYGNECKSYLEQDGHFEEDLMFYSCYEGGKFFPLLFGFKKFDQNQLNKIPNKQLEPLLPDYIYHCRIETRGVKRNYFTDQVHYFTIFMGEKTILFQTYGGVKGILIKYIHNDINDIIKEIIFGSTEHYRLLFEIPKEM